MKLTSLVSIVIQAVDKKNQPIPGAFKGYGPGDVFVHQDKTEAQKLIDVGYAEAAK